MNKWLLGQKVKYDRGMQVVGLINFCLLVLANSDRLKAYIPLSSTGIVLVAIPAMIALVWFAGWVQLRVGCLGAEEDALAQISPTRQEIRETLAIVREIKEKMNDRKA